MNANPDRKRVFVALCCLFAFNLLLRVFYLRYDFVNGDEAVRALTAVRYLEGATLYVDIVTDKPPGATLFYALVFKLFGKSMSAVHVAASIWHFATAVMVFLIGSRVFDKRTGLWASLLLIYFSTNYFTQDTMAANTELLMSLPYTGAFYLFLRGVTAPDCQSGRSAVPLFAAGLLVGTAVLFKQIGVFELVYFALCSATICLPASNRDPEMSNDGLGLWRRLSQSAAVLLPVLAGVVFVAGCTAVWLASTGALPGFWRYVVELGAFYVSSLPSDQWLRFMITRTSGFILFNAVLWSLAAWSLMLSIARAKRSQSGYQENRFDLMIGLWAVVSLAPVFSSGRFFGHYFIPALPALSLLGARGLLRLRAALASATVARRARVAALLLSLILIIGLVRFHQRTVVLAYETMTGRRTRISEDWGMTKREREADEIAGYVRSKVKEGEPLFIWGYALDVYWRSGCRPASRYLTPYYITGVFYPDVTENPKALTERFWLEARANLIEDLKASKPQLILNIDEPILSLPHSEIVDFINTHYRQTGVIGPDPAHQFIVFEKKDNW